MRRVLFAAAFAVLAVSGADAQNARTVNVYNWSDYIGETTLADFEAETGIGVVYDLYASSEEMQAKMLAGASGYDLVLQSGLSLQYMVAAGQQESPRAAVFRPSSANDPMRPALAEVFALLRVAFGGPARPEQGLLITRRLYDSVGGHTPHADAETALLRRLGRRRLAMLPVGARPPR